MCDVVNKLITVNFEPDRQTNGGESKSQRYTVVNPLSPRSRVMAEPSRSNSKLFVTDTLTAIYIAVDTPVK